MEYGRIGWIQQEVYIYIYIRSHFGSSRKRFRSSGLMTEGGGSAGHAVSPAACPTPAGPPRSYGPQRAGPTPAQPSSGGLAAAPAAEELPLPRSGSREEPQRPSLPETGAAAPRTPERRRERRVRARSPAEVVDELGGGATADASRSPERQRRRKRRPRRGPPRAHARSFPWAAEAAVLDNLGPLPMGTPAPPVRASRVTHPRASAGATASKQTAS